MRAKKREYEETIRLIKQKVVAESGNHDFWYLLYIEYGDRIKLDRFQASGTPEPTSSTIGSRTPPIRHPGAASGFWLFCQGGTDSVVFFRPKLWTSPPLLLCSNCSSLQARVWCSFPIRLIWRVCPSWYWIPRAPFYSEELYFPTSLFLLCAFATPHCRHLRLEARGCWVLLAFTLAFPSRSSSSFRTIRFSSVVWAFPRARAPSQEPAPALLPLSQFQSLSLPRQLLSPSSLVGVLQASWAFLQGGEDSLQASLLGLRFPPSLTACVFHWLRICWFVFLFPHHQG